MTDQPTSVPAEEPALAETPPAAPASSPIPALAITLAAVLLLVVGLVATAPLWAPLLPWGPAANDEAQRAFAARLERLEAAQAQAQAQPKPPEQEQLRQQIQQAAAETKTSLQRIAQRLEALETRPTPPSPAGDIAEIRQQAAKSSQTAAELAARLDAVEKSLQAQAARDSGDAALLLALLKIRSAVQAGRPFAAEYEAFAALARSRPEFAAAAAPLAGPAKSGVASPAALAKRLRELAGGIAAARAAAPATEVSAPGWADATLARLRGLVTIRRVDGARPGSAEAAINAAELALAGGDLAAAVAALDTLTGAPAEAAVPWRRMAHERLAVDTALRQIESLLTSRLGTPLSTPGSSG